MQNFTIALLIKVLSIWLFTTPLSASSEELWIEGFGPIKFGQSCKDKTLESESYSHQGFHIEVKCLNYRETRSGGIFYMSISSKSLSLDTAQDLISTKITEKEKTIEPSWSNCITGHFGVLECRDFFVKGWLGVLDHNCNSVVKNAVRITQFMDSPLWPERKLNKGLTQIEIWAPTLECKEKKYLIEN